jgi:hypothetical protein
MPAHGVPTHCGYPLSPIERGLYTGVGEIANEAQFSNAEVFCRAIAICGLTRRANLNREQVIICNGGKER